MGCGFGGWSFACPVSRFPYHRARSRIGGFGEQREQIEGLDGLILLDLAPWAINKEKETPRLIGAAVRTSSKRVRAGAGLALLLLSSRGCSSNRARRWITCIHDTDVCHSRCFDAIGRAFNSRGQLGPSESSSPFYGAIEGCDCETPSPHTRSPRCARRRSDI